VKRLVILLGVLLLVLGVIGLLHPSFTYHQKEEVAKLGPLQATVDEQKTAQIPPAVSLTLLAAGVLLLVLSARTNR
jgi:hypothetical protein